MEKRTRKARSEVDKGKAERTAIEFVVISTPPSGLALNVSFAALRRVRGPLTLADQHCVRVSSLPMK
jgi:hypothetical protein